MFGRKQKQPKNENRRPPSVRSGTVFSYYQNRVIPTDDSVQSTNLREKKRTLEARRHHLPMIVTLLVIILCVGYSLSLARNPRIVVVNEEDRATKSLLRSVDVYQDAAQKIMESSPLNYSKLTISTKNVGKALQTQFPEIAEATVSLPLINRRPVIYVQITQPVFLLNKQNDIYALDERGRVIMKGDGTLPASDLSHITDQTGHDAEIGKQFLPLSQMQFLQSVQAQLKEKGVTDITFILPPLANEVYFKQNDKPYFVKMTFASDARIQAGTFLALKQKLETDKVNPAEYIDVRVEERAYYK